MYLQICLERDESKTLNDKMNKEHKQKNRRPQNLQRQPKMIQGKTTLVSLCEENKKDYGIIDTRGFERRYFSKDNPLLPNPDRYTTSYLLFILHNYLLFFFRFLSFLFIFAFVYFVVPLFCLDCSFRLVSARLLFVSLVRF